MRFISSSLMLSGVLAMTMAGCGNGGSGGEASVELGITAQPIQSITLPSEGPGPSAAQKRLVVTVDQVKLHVAVKGADDEADDDSALETDTSTDMTTSGWKMAFSGSTDVDLLDATATEALLSTIVVPAGKITQVRLVLSDAKLIEGDTTLPVTCSSCAETGLKIILGGKVDVVDGDRLHLQLDFDQATSLTHDGAGYRLAPVIKLVKADQD
jgi:hypothetical protein